jgi:pimeloyl-ACP methyl ester carboxylesterase
VLLRLFVLRPAVADAVCDWMCDHRAAAAALGRLLRPDLPRPLAEDRLRHTRRSYSETLAKVILAAGAAAPLDDVQVPVHLVAGDAGTILDLAFLRALERRHANVSLSLWPNARHEIPLTHPDDCLRELSRARARVQVPPSAAR